jgi:hypothetical protein
MSAACFDQKRDVLFAGKVGRPRQIPHERVFRSRPLLGCNLARHAMDRAAADRGDEIKRLLEDRIPIGFPARYSGQAGIAVTAAHRGVDAELDQAMLLDLGPNRSRRLVVGKLQFHRLEAGRSRGAEALNRRPFGEEIGEIGGETRHGSPSRVSADTILFELPRLCQRLTRSIRRTGPVISKHFPPSKVGNKWGKGELSRLHNPASGLALDLCCCSRYLTLWDSAHKFAHLHSGRICG